MARAKVLYVYDVDGRGKFPIDMLRYDRATPHREEDSKKISDTQTGFYAHVQYSITVQSFHKPTVGRWKSFGWEVPAEMIQEVKVA